jgi:Uma2 family endonuclease
MATTSETLLLSFEEFERLQDQPGKQELLEGELIEMPVPEAKHGRSSKRVFKALDDALVDAQSRGEAMDLGEAFFEMGYRLGERSWAIPDVSITHAGQSEGKYMEGAPAIAIEIVSPSNRADALDAKTELYFQHGAREVWHLYPKTRHFVIHVGGASQVRVEPEAVTTPLLPGFSLSLKAILGN